MPPHRNHKIHLQTQYYKKIQMKVCVLCVQPVVRGFVKCQTHLDYQREYIKARNIERKENGLCVWCKEPARRTRGGKLLCSVHLNKANEYQKQRAERHITAGLCRQCKQPQENGKTMCYDHLKQGRERSKRYYEAKQNGA